MSKFCENVVQKPVSHRGMLGGVVLMLALVFITGANRIERRTLEGFAEPYQTIEIAASEAGIVQEVLVELGQAVKKGDVLAVLDDEVLKASLEIAQLKAQSTAALDASKVEIELRQQKLAALTQLNRSGSGSREEYARAKADVEFANAKLKGAEETLAADRLEVKKIDAQLRQRTIRASLNGVVTDIHRDPGEFVSGAEPKLFTVVRLDRLRVKFYVPAEHSLRLNKSDRVKIQAANDDKPTAAEVEFVSPVTHAESGLVRVDVILDNRDGRLRSGQRWLLIQE
ncbi:MAG: efflux RND transporter periplasmic adaptor subunit [Planctomycetia bacterium]|nr:efflux RND transporter periplasmic adaptor subunit [Planctomycetia bacterium]